MADHAKNTSGQGQDSKNRVSSETMARFTIDALIDAKILRQEDLAKAMKIATEEIEVRKACGDY